MTLAEIWDTVAPALTNPLTTTIMGAVLGGIAAFAAPRYLGRAFDRATGLTEVRDNAGSILSQARTYHLVSPKHERAKGISLAGDLPGGIGSIMEIDPALESLTFETASDFHFIMRDGPEKTTWSIFTLDLKDEEDAALYLTCCDYPLEPEKIRNILTERNMCALPEDARKVCRAAAARAKPTRASWASRAQVADGSAATVDQAMTATVLALAASSEPEINLSRRCHLAVKSNDHIVVRILTQEEREIAPEVVKNGDFGKTAGRACGQTALESAAALAAARKEAARRSFMPAIVTPH